MEKKYIDIEKAMEIIRMVHDKYHDICNANPKLSDCEGLKGIDKACQKIERGLKTIPTSSSIMPAKIGDTMYIVDYVVRHKEYRIYTKKIICIQIWNDYVSLVDNDGVAYTLGKTAFLSEGEANSEATLKNLEECWDDFDLDF